MSLPLYDSGTAAGLLAGVLFGYVLEGAGFGSPRKLTAQFRLSDWSVFKVMFTAVIVAALGLWSAEALGAIAARSVFVPTTYFWATGLGGILIGVGFAIGGYCPGTSTVGLASGRGDAFVFILGMMAGSALFAAFFAPLEGLYRAAPGPKGQTLSDLLGLPEWLVILALTAMAAGGWRLGSALERRFGGPLTAEQVFEGASTAPVAADESRGHPATVKAAPRTPTIQGVLMTRKRTLLAMTALPLAGALVGAEGSRLAEAAGPASIAATQGPANPCAARPAIVGAGANPYDVAAGHAQAPYGDAMPAIVNNYLRAAPYVGTGGLIEPGAFARLKALGFKTVINLNTEQEGAKEEGEAATKAGLTYFSIPVATTAPTSDQVDAFSRYVNDPILYPILVHCVSSNRVGATWAIYRARNGVPPEIAIQEGRNVGLKPSREKAVREILKLPPMTR